MSLIRVIEFNCCSSLPGQVQVVKETPSQGLIFLIDMTMH